MSIAFRQFGFIAQKILNKVLKKGKAIDQYLMDELAKDQEYVPGKPFTQLYSQPYRATFDPTMYNEMVENLSDDLTILFSEHNVMLNKVLGMIAVSDTAHGFYKHQIKELEAAINALILMSPGTDIGMVVYDYFQDLLKIDQSQSNAALDMRNEAITLGRLPDAARVPFTHLATVVNPVVQLSPEDAELTDIQGGLNQAIINTTAGWTFNIKTDEPTVVRAWFDIPLAESGATVWDLSRIDFEPFAFSPFRVQMYGSLDGANYTYLEGHSSPKWVVSKNVSWIFPSRRMRYLRVEFIKDSPDSSDSQGRPVYNFGMKVLACFKMGFAVESELVSKAQTPQGVSTNRPITKMTVATEEEVFPTTDIDYFISANDGDTWIPITPVNKNATAAASIINLDKPTPSYDRVDVTTAPASLATVKARDFYSLYTFPNAPIKESVVIDRGMFGWTFDDKRVRTENREVVNYISFEDGDEQPLYVTEHEMVREHSNWDGTNQVSLKTDYPLYFKGEATETGVTPVFEDQPEGSIFQVIRQMGPGLMNETEVPCQVYIDARKIEKKMPDRPVPVTLIDFVGVAPPSIPAGAPSTLYSTDPRAVTELVGRDFHWTYELDGGRNIGGINKILSATIEESTGDLILMLEDRRKLLPDVAITMGRFTWYIPSQDVTRLVTRIEGNIIYLHEDLPVYWTDQFEVSYRRRLLPNERVQSTKTKVELGGKEYRRDYGPPVRSDVNFEEGNDYKIKPAVTGASILRMQTGNIRKGDDFWVIVKYQIESDWFTVNNYGSYLYAEGPRTQTIPITPIQINGDQGEVAQIAGQDLTQVNQLVIKPGWNRVEVKADNIWNTQQVVNKASALYKVVNMTDTRGRYIFPAFRQTDMVGLPAPSAFASYFTRQAAIVPGTMGRTTVHNLTTGIKPGNIQNWFAVKDPTELAVTAETRAIIGWDPINEPKVMVFPPDVSGTSEPSYTESFTVRYKAMLSEDPVTSIRFKAVLRREGNPQLTPILHSYTIRFAL